MSKKQRAPRKKVKKQRKQTAQSPKQFQGNKQERSAHFKAVHEASSMVEAVATKPRSATGKTMAAITAAIEAAGGVSVLNKKQRAAYEAGAKQAAAYKERSRKGWETRRENKARARAVKLSEYETEENAKLRAAGDLKIAALRGMLVQATLYRKTGQAVLGNTSNIMRDLKAAGVIPMDIRDIYGGQTKGGQHVAGMHPDWDVSDVEEYWTFDRAREIMDWAKSENVDQQLMATVRAYGDIKNLEAITTRQGRADLLARKIAGKSGGTAPVVGIYTMPEIVQKSAVLSMITRFIAEVYYEDKQKDARNMKRYKSMFGNKSINEAAREKTKQIAKFMQFTDYGTKFVKIDDYIDNAIQSGKATLTADEVKQDKAEIASLIPQIALKGRDTITDTRNGEIFIRILEILGKYGYN